MLPIATLRITILQEFERFTHNTLIEAAILKQGHSTYQPTSVVGNTL